MSIRFVDKIISMTPPKILGRMLWKVPRSVIDWKKHASFQYIVRYVYKKSAFYRRKFDEYKIDPRKVKNPSDLGDFYTTPQDIVDHAEEFLCRKPQIVFESSGTTGRNKRVYMTQDELDDIGKYNAAGLFIGGVKPDDRLVNAFDFCMWIPGIITQKGLEQAGLFGMAAGKVDPIEVYKRIPVYNFNIIMGEPTWLIKLTEIAEKNGSYPLKMIIGSAEGMPDAARPWMEKVWQGVQIRMVYGSVESAGTIAFEAFSLCDGYHIDETNFLVEIADPGEDGYGEVIFTTLGRMTMPLIRYRNRDISRIIEEKCICGLPYRRLAKIRGRVDELVVASGGNLYPLMFEEILKDVEGISSDWQIIFKLHGIKEIMEINLELQEGHSKKAIQEKVFSNMQSRYPDLWKNYGLGIFEIEFFYHAPHSLRADKRKLLRLVDKRHT